MASRSDEALVSLRARAERGDWEAVEEVFDRLEAAERERDRFKLMAERGQDAETEKIERGTRLLAARDKIIDALDELGIPDENYPAPVANAIKFFQEALAAIPLESTSEKSVERDPQPQEDKP